MRELSQSFKSPTIPGRFNYPLKLCVARGTGLPDERDDLPAYVYKVAKSWKHNSRRKHQYHKQDLKKGLIDE